MSDLYVLKNLQNDVTNDLCIIQMKWNDKIYYNLLILLLCLVVSGSLFIGLKTNALVDNTMFFSVIYIRQVWVLKPYGFNLKILNKTGD